jgi:hypothetical protein
MLPPLALQSPPLLLATIVFLSTGSFPDVVRRIPPPEFAELLLIVTLVSVRATPAVALEIVRIPPPEPLALPTVLSLTVTLVRVAL